MTASGSQRGKRAGPFIATKEHRRFVEFADAVRRNAYIGLCYGPAGVGKTLSARRYSHWDRAEELLQTWGPRQHSDAAVYAGLAKSRTVFYTPAVATTLKQVKADIDLLVRRVEICIDEHIGPELVVSASPSHLQLIVIDEAERLPPAALEHLRDYFDRRPIGLLLIGMPGIDKRLVRYPQFYSRVGFAHHYQPLTDEELTFVLTKHWQRLGLKLDLSDFTDTQAVAAIGRVSRGNFRLLQRLFVQIERVLAINQLHVITDEVVEAARGTLLIGAT